MCTGMLYDSPQRGHLQAYPRHLAEGKQTLRLHPKAPALCAAFSGSMCWSSECDSQCLHQRLLDMCPKVDLPLPQDMLC